MPSGAIVKPPQRLALLAHAFVLLSLCVQVCCADIPRWLSVMPLHENVADELAADAAALGNDTFVDGIVWSCPVTPEGDPVTDRAG